MMTLMETDISYMNVKADNKSENSKDCLQKGLQEKKLFSSSSDVSKILTNIMQEYCLIVHSNISLSLTCDTEKCTSAYSISELYIHIKTDRFISIYIVNFLDTAIIYM